jgi:archaellum biogenesis ATPase FlaH
MFDQSHVIGVVVATVLFIIALLLIVFVRSRRVRRDVVLLVGLSDAGKTKMYCRLVTGLCSLACIRLLSCVYAGGDVRTFTSQCENISKNVSFSGGDDESVHTITLVDVPGADRVRKPRMHHWLRTTAAAKSVKGIVVVVDSATFTKQARDVAELIYDTLANTNASVLIAANKSDLPMAKSSDVRAQARILA